MFSWMRVMLGYAWTDAQIQERGVLFAKHLYQVSTKLANNSNTGQKYRHDVALKNCFVTFTLDDMLAAHLYSRTRRLAKEVSRKLRQLIGAKMVVSGGGEVLGLLATAYILDQCLAIDTKDTIENVMKHVFSAQKLRVVGRIVMDCLRKYQKYSANKEILAEELSLAENCLGKELMKVIRTMTYDCQATADEFRGWIHGVAFHMQLLLQLVRLGKNRHINETARNYIINLRTLVFLLKVWYSSLVDVAVVKEESGHYKMMIRDRVMYCDVISDAFMDEKDDDQRVFDMVETEYISLHMGHHYSGEDLKAFLYKCQVNNNNDQFNLTSLKTRNLDLKRHVDEYLKTFY